MNKSTIKKFKKKLKIFEKISYPTPLRRSSSFVPTGHWFKGAGDLLILSSINRWATRIPSKVFAVPSPPPPQGLFRPATTELDRVKKH
ncbi:hypothetical protein AYI68_g1747 [Smittium mucronatum]|uniref:Uncharacterized protein n=1 Tax=Smittium mucronatum TaxID=133383 RepID=A0A1R0H4K3_9FUNG|nr:hypothetical protein AYI68_g1747 [Smittium mucronatum]